MYTAPKKYLGRGSVFFKMSIYTLLVVLVLPATGLLAVMGAPISNFRPNWVPISYVWFGQIMVLSTLLLVPGVYMFAQVHDLDALPDSVALSIIGGGVLAFALIIIGTLVSCLGYMSYLDSVRNAGSPDVAVLTLGGVGLTAAKGMTLSAFMGLALLAVVSSAGHVATLLLEWNTKRRKRVSVK